MRDNTACSRTCAQSIPADVALYLTKSAHGNLTYWRGTLSAPYTRASVVLTILAEHIAPCGDVGRRVARQVNAPRHRFGTAVASGPIGQLVRLMAVGLLEGAAESGVTAS